MPGHIEQVLSFGPFTLRGAERRLFEAGREVRLGERAFDLLFALVERSGEVVSKQNLIAIVWGGRGIEEATLRAHIAVLRTVLGEGQDGQRYIVNVAGRGYCFVAAIQVQRDAPTLQMEPMPPTSSRHNLPDLLTRVVGREELISGIARQLSHRRLVCIAGSAGMGKTTVALAVAERLLDRYRDGIRFVDLSVVSDPAAVPAAVASALDTVVASGQPISSVVRFLSDKSMLLVLDNCEHVAEAAAEVAVSILRGAPALNVLATSREPLRAGGEWVQRLPPLEMPRVGVEFTAADALTYPAIRLFVERAIASVDSFQLMDRDVDIVCDICRRLDGMPLAIELAAARMATFGIRGLRRALDDRLDVLSSRQRAGTLRHRTLEALLEWSHEMLPPQEKVVFRRLAVFRGGFSLESAQAVAMGDDADARQVVDALASLAAKSLVSAEFRQQDVHYRMLETTRAYAYRKLEASGEVEARLLLHATRVCVLFEGGSELDKTLARSGWVVAYSWLIGDVRAALDWALGEGGNAGIGVRLANATIALCHQLSLQEEFRERVSVALSLAQELVPRDPLAEMRLNIAFSAVSYQTRGPSEAMARCCERALELSRLPELATHLHEAIFGAWMCAFAHGVYDETLEWSGKLAQIAQESMLPNLALVADRIRAQSLHFSGEHATSRTLAQRVLSHSTAVIRLSNVRPPAIERGVSMRILLARIHWLEGRAQQAADLASECVEIASEDVSYSLCQALAFAACPIAFWRGDLVAARNLVDRLIRHGAERNLQYWQRWGRNFRQVLSRHDDAAGGQFDASTAGLDIDAADDKQRDLFGTLGIFDGDERTVRRAELGSNGWCAAEILRVHGEWLLRQDDGNASRAHDAFERALALSRAQGALSWELRAATSLSRLWHSTGRVEEARRLLSELLGRFTEGLDTVDLLRVRGMLQEFEA